MNKRIGRDTNTKTGRKEKKTSEAKGSANAKMTMGPANLPSRESAGPGARSGRPVVEVREEERGDGLPRVRTEVPQGPVHKKPVSVGNL